MTDQTAKITLGDTSVVSPVLSGTVGPDERGDFPFVDAYVHVPEGLDVAVEGVDVGKLQHVGHHDSPR